MSIQTELTRIINAKAAIKAAIEGKGVTVPNGTLLDGMAALIESIEAGGGGGGQKIITGEFTLDTAACGVLVEHNLGDIPNFAYYFAMLAPSTSNQYGTYVTRFFCVYLDGKHYSYSVSGGMSNKATKYVSTIKGIAPTIMEADSGGAYVAANSANDKTIIIGGNPSSTYGYFKNAVTYKWGVGVI